ncbi:MAG: NAD(P)/FAD-dependent oxidoreductase [Clostridium sp.]|jgi:glycerol-3-phosphate dehydrogenase|nr:NAD(P)/FAD-dependent oxidoreductase [Clostridium sp.]
MLKELRVLQSKLSRRYPGVECSAFGDSVRIEGCMEDWEEIVRCGKYAAKAGFRAVINDVKLKDFTAPAMRTPAVKDYTLQGLTPDVLIIGGGVIGCSIARELARWQLSVLLVDKEDDVAMHASSRNDGMIHPGIASHPGTLRGEYNVRGNAMYDKICKELSVPFERWSNLILYRERWFGLAARFLFAYRQKALGVPGYHIGRRRLVEEEPNITDEAVGAFEYPTSGILSPYKLTVALADNAVENGVKISLNTVVEGMKTEHGAITEVQTNRGTLMPKLVVNAAGCFCDTVADMAGDRFFSIHPRKGECCILDKDAGPLSQRSMGLIGLAAAFSTSKGGGIMRTIDGNVLVGPDAYEQPLREDFSTHKSNIDAVMNKHLPLIKGFNRGQVITYFAGIRAASYEEEFIIEGSERVKNLVHAAGIQSPGLASAPAIAEEICKLVLGRLGGKILPNPRFNPVRNAAPVMAKLSLEEKQRVIEQNPEYGVVVCRCEGISKGEIRAAVRAPLPATSIDAIKRRVRPGMGRCQGGFCSPLVAELLGEEGIANVTKKGAGSELFVGELGATQMEDGKND